MFPLGAAACPELMPRSFLTLSFDSPRSLGLPIGAPGGAAITSSACPEIYHTRGYRRWGVWRGGAIAEGGEGDSGGIELEDFGLGEDDRGFLGVVEQ